MQRGSNASGPGPPALRSPQDALFRAEHELSAAQSRLEQQQAQLADKAAALADAVERHQVRPCCWTCWNLPALPALRPDLCIT